MQIGGLGFIQSLASTGTIEQGNGKGAFAGLLLNLRQPAISDDVSLNKEGQVPSEKITNELIQFLNTTDLSQMDIFPELAQSLDSNEDIIKFIQNLLELNDQELISAITSFLKNVNLKTKGEDFNLEIDFSSQEIADLIEKLPEMDGDEAFMAFVQILPLIPMDQVTLKTDNQFSMLVKTLKLFDLLSNDDHSNINNSNLKQFLQAVGEKLELTQAKNDSLYRDILYKTFTPVVKDRQIQSISKHSGHTDLGLHVQQINEIGNNQEILFFQPVSKQEQLIIFNSHSGKQVSVEQMIKQFEAILSKSHFLQTGDNQKLFIKLFPEHLGALRVELIQQESGIIAKLMTSTSSAKEILESQLQSLRQAFSSQNIQIDRIEISTGFNNPERFVNKDPQQQGGGQQKQQEEQKQQNDQTFTTTFEETLLNVEV